MRNLNCITLIFRQEALPVGARAWLGIKFSGTINQNLEVKLKKFSSDHILWNVVNNFVIDEWEFILLLSHLEPNIELEKPLERLRISEHFPSDNYHAFNWRRKKTASNKSLLSLPNFRPNLTTFSWAMFFMPFAYRRLLGPVQGLYKSLGGLSSFLLFSRRQAANHSNENNFYFDRSIYLESI